MLIAGLGIACGGCTDDLYPQCGGNSIQFDEVLKQGVEAGELTQAGVPNVRAKLVEKNGIDIFDARVINPVLGRFFVARANGALSVVDRYPADFRICLCHQPQGWHQAIAAGAELTLSGHTHGGQIALTNRNLNAARLSTRYISGPYRREDAFLYVSRGVGVGAIPVRVGAPPEIDLLTLRSLASAAKLAA